MFQTYFLVKKNLKRDFLVKPLLVCFFSCFKKTAFEIKLLKFFINCVCPACLVDGFKVLDSAAQWSSIELLR